MRFLLWFKVQDTSKDLRYIIVNKCLKMSLCEQKIQKNPQKFSYSISIVSHIPRNH